MAHQKLSTLGISEISEIVTLALKEDIGKGDITASLIPQNQQSQAIIISRQAAIVCGTQFVDATYQKLNQLTQKSGESGESGNNSEITITWHVKDGDKVKPKQTLCTLQGNTRLLLSGERSALNFLQTLSSTATLTSKFVEKIKNAKGTKTKLLDTRKTLPGLRHAQKYAVLCGGGHNHRFGLYDAILIKENHIAACENSITKAVETARNNFPDKLIEVEVTNLEELKEALNLPLNRIMLDNFNLENIKAAVKIANDFNANHNYKSKQRIKLEVSGGVTLENIEEIAATDVDYISVGTITKTVIAIDFSMIFVKS